MASGKIANLSVGVALEMAEFINGLGAAENEALAWRDRMVSWAEMAGTAIGAGLAGGLATFVAQLNSVADELDAFNDLRDTTSASIENISALDDIARKTGATFEDVSATLVKFNKTLGESGDNVKGDIFRDLKLDLVELKRIDPAEAFQQTAKALAEVENNAAKSQVLLELFGKSASQIAPYLNDVGEAGALVAVSTEAQSQAAEDYNKALAKFNAEAQTAIRTLTADFLPVMTEIVKSLGSGADAVKLFGSVVTGTFQVVAVVGSDVAHVFGTLGREIGAWGAQLNALAHGDLQGFRAISDAVKADADRARAELDAFQNRVMLVQNKSFTKPQSGASVPAAEGADKDAPKRSLADPATTDAYRKYIAALDQTIERTKELTEVQKVQAAIAAGNMSLWTEEQRKVALAKAAEADAGKARIAANKEAEAARQKYESQLEAAAKKSIGWVNTYVEGLRKQLEHTEGLTHVEITLARIQQGRFAAAGVAAAGEALAMSDAIDQRQKYADQFDEMMAKVKEEVSYERQIAEQRQSWFDATRTPLEQYTAQLDHLNRIFENGTKETDTYVRSLAILQKQLEDQTRAAAEAKDEMVRFANESQRSIQSALGDTLEDALTGNFDSIGKKWLALLTRMAAQAAAIQLKQALFGKDDVSGPLSGVFGKIFGVGGVDAKTLAGNQALFNEFGTTTLSSVPVATAAMGQPSASAMKRVASMSSALAESASNAATYDFSGAVYHIGSNVSLPEVRAAVEQGNARLEAKLRRSREQSQRSA